MPRLDVTAPRLSYLLAAALAAGLLFGVAVERALGDRLWVVDTPAPPRDPSGRRLYLLIIDSLAAENIEHLPSLRALADEGFSAVMDPCADAFTAPCVREALTGRPVFSLLSMLENFGVTRPDPGPNLLADARRAGLRAAFVSDGDLETWRGLADTDLQAREPFDPRQVELGLQAAREHDLVIHHWVWHDVETHHARRGSERYLASLARTDKVIHKLLRGLPRGVDLMVMGDHGHTSDGRHVQGLDVPTRVVVSSPNLQPLRPDGRVPLTAARFLAGAVTGLASPAARVEPAWRAWLAPRVGDALRDAGRPQPMDQGVALIDP